MSRLSTEDHAYKRCTRRRLLQASLGLGLLRAAAAAGIVLPRTGSAEWSRALFASRSYEEALARLCGSKPISTTDRIEIDTVDLAEDGAVVPVRITARLASIEWISILADRNPVPLLAMFTLAAGVHPYIATRIKLAASSHLVVAVAAEDRIYLGRKFIQVIAGGCD